MASPMEVAKLENGGQSTSSTSALQSDNHLASNQMASSIGKENQETDVQSSSSPTSPPGRHLSSRKGASSSELAKMENEGKSAILFISPSQSGVDLSSRQTESNGTLALKKELVVKSASDFAYGKLLGLGSFSKVVQATVKRTGQEVALKIMDKQLIIRERKVPYVKLERHVLEILDHPGVVKCFFTFQDELSLYIALECCPGGELFDQIKVKGRIAIKDARFYAAEIVDTLEYIHGQGIIHRDLKPENILLTAEGHLKLVDFGSAKLLRPLDGVPFQPPPDERNSSFVGTAEYVSPEVLDSQPVTTGADMWALGCIIYFMLEGRPPFKAASEYLCFQKVMSRDFTMPDHFPPEAGDLINQLLNMDPQKRPGVGPTGFSGLKEHPFFNGVDWSDLRRTTPPPLAPRPASGSSSSEDDADSCLSADEDWELAQMGIQLARLTAGEPVRTCHGDGTGEAATAGLLEGDRGTSNSMAFSLPPTGAAGGESSITDEASFYKWWVSQEDDEQEEIDAEPV